MGGTAHREALGELRDEVGEGSARVLRARSRSWARDWREAGVAFLTPHNPGPLALSVSCQGSDWGVGDGYGSRGRRWGYGGVF